MSNFLLQLFDSLRQHVIEFLGKARTAHGGRIDLQKIVALRLLAKVGNGPDAFRGLSLEKRTNAENFKVLQRRENKYENR